MASPSIPVIVIGRGVTALGSMRCLARRGVRIYTACDDRLATSSRYYRPAVTTTGQRWQCELGAQGHDILAAMPHERAVLFPCADDITMWVAQLPSQLTDRFLSCTPPESALTLLQDKVKFAQLCQTLAVPHPRCYFVSTLEELESLPLEEMPRVFFKPSNSVAFMQRFAVKGMWANSRQRSREVFQQIRDSGQDVFVQEYVAGGADDHYFIDGFIDRQGTIRAKFARRRIRIYPVDFGNSSYCYHVPIETIQPAWDSLQRILTHVGYRGIFSAEFKRDAVDGEFRILEINTRAWVYVEFAAWCGIDVCQLAYRDACGEAVPTLDVTRAGAGCVDLYHDYCSIRSTPRSTRPNWWRVIYQWTSSHKPVFSITDPCPALSWTSRTCQNRLKRLWQR